MNRSAGSLPRVGLGGGLTLRCGEVIGGVDGCSTPRILVSSCDQFRVSFGPTWFSLHLSSPSRRVRLDAQLSYARETAEKLSLKLKLCRIFPTTCSLCQKSQRKSNGHYVAKSGSAPWHGFTHQVNCPVLPSASVTCLGSYMPRLCINSGEVHQRE